MFNYNFLHCKRLIIGSPIELEIFLGKTVRLLWTFQSNHADSGSYKIEPGPEGGLPWIGFTESSYYRERQPADNEVELVERATAIDGNGLKWITD